MCGRLAFEGVTHPKCRTQYGIDGLTSFFHYDGVIRKAIKAIKYRYITDLAEEFVSLVPDFKKNTSFLIPIPLHISRFRERGYNQAEVLGKLLAKQLAIPVETNVLVRVKKTIPQAAIKHRKERLKNMDSVFETKNTVSGPVLLFDDVFTTGATMRAAAEVLKQKGAKSIWAMTMAR